MKVTMTNFEIEAAINLLGSLEETGVLGYAIAKNLRTLKAETIEYQDTCLAWIKEHGDHKKDGTVTYSPAEMREALRDIGNLPLEVNVFQVSLDVFTSGNLNSRQMEALMDLNMVKEEG